MKDFVSSRWVGAAGLAASLSAIWFLFVPYGSPSMGLVWVSLVLSTALWLGIRPTTRSMRRVIDDVEGEPARAAVAVPASQPVTRAVL